MATMKVVPVRPTREDCLAVATILNSAYFESCNLFYLTLFPLSQHELIANMALLWPKNLYAPGTWHLKVENEQTGQIMSYSRWVLPDELLQRLDDRPKPTPEDMEKYEKCFQLGCDNGVPKGMNVKMADEEEILLEEARKSFPVEHIVLDMVMTSPSYQRSGAAAAHIQWGLALADEHNLAVVLEATPMAKEFYTRYGFEVVKEVTHNLEPNRGSGYYTHYMMVRKGGWFELV